MAAVPPRRPRPTQAHLRATTRSRLEGIASRTRSNTIINIWTFSGSTRTVRVLYVRSNLEHWLHYILLTSRYFRRLRGTGHLTLSLEYFGTICGGGAMLFLSPFFLSSSSCWHLTGMLSTRGRREPCVHSRHGCCSQRASRCARRVAPAPARGDPHTSPCFPSLRGRERSSLCSP